MVPRSKILSIATGQRLSRRGHVTPTAPVLRTGGVGKMALSEEIGGTRDAVHVSAPGEQPARQRRSYVEGTQGRPSRIPEARVDAADGRCRLVRARAWRSGTESRRRALGAGLRRRLHPLRRALALRAPG